MSKKQKEKRENDKTKTNTKDQDHGPRPRPRTKTKTKDQGPRPSPRTKTKPRQSKRPRPLPLPLPLPCQRSQTKVCSSCSNHPVCQTLSGRSHWTTDRRLCRRFGRHFAYEIQVRCLHRARHQRLYPQQPMSRCYAPSEARTVGANNNDADEEKQVER